MDSCVEKAQRLLLTVYWQQDSASWLRFGEGEVQIRCRFGASVGTGGGMNGGYGDVIVGALTSTQNASKEGQAIVSFSGGGRLPSDQLSPRSDAFAQSSGQCPTTDRV